MSCTNPPCSTDVTATYSNHAIHHQIIYQSCYGHEYKVTADIDWSTPRRVPRCPGPLATLNNTQLWSSPDTYSTLTSLASKKVAVVSGTHVTWSSFPLINYTCHSAPLDPLPHQQSNYRRSLHVQYAFASVSLLSKFLVLSSITSFLVFCVCCICRSPFKIISSDGHRPTPRPGHLKAQISRHHQHNFCCYDA